MITISVINTANDDDARLTLSSVCNDDDVLITIIMTCDQLREVCPECSVHSLPSTHREATATKGVDLQARDKHNTRIKKEVSLVISRSC